MTETRKVILEGGYAHETPALQFDPHLLYNNEPFISERQFKRYLTRAILKHGCVHHGKECPLMEPLPIIRSRND